jgi:16S rRNA (guanine527-N7)-methyltransferase
MLVRAGIELNAEKTELLWRYHVLLRDRNADRDLTRIVGFESMVVKHYIDSLIVGNLVKLPSPLLDIGSGAGLPGIPLKIRYPHLRITLAEPRPRRVQFLGDVRASLHLEGLEIFDHRVSSRSYTEPVAGVITRAFETIDKTLARTTGCTGVGTLFIFMKGPGVNEEIDEAMSRFGDSVRLVSDKPYSLPNTPHQRRLVVLERTKPSEE